MWYNSARLKRILQIGLIAALTIFFIGLFLWKADLHQVWRIMRSTSPFWLGIALLTNVGALMLRTARWRTILDPENPPPFYATFFATTLGYMLSTILPIRAADVARPALLSRKTDVRMARAFGTVITERILDLGMILVLFLYFCVRRWHDFAVDPRTARWVFVIRAGAITSGTMLAGLAAFLVGIYFFRDRVRVMHEWLGRFVPKRFRDAWMHFFDSFVETLELTKHRSAFARIVLFTFGIWMALTGQLWFTSIGMGKHMPYDSSIFITGVTTLGLAIPTPGGVGGFHKVCQLVLQNFYKFDVNESVATAILFHIVSTLPVIIVGTTLFLREGLRWKDVAPKA